MYQTHTWIPPRGALFKTVSESNWKWSTIVKMVLLLVDYLTVQSHNCDPKRKIDYHSIEHSYSSTQTMEIVDRFNKMCVHCFEVSPFSSFQSYRLIESLWEKNDKGIFKLLHVCVMHFINLKIAMHNLLTNKHFWCLQRVQAKFLW